MKISKLNKILSTAALVIAAFTITSLQGAELRYPVENDSEELIIAVHFQNGELFVNTHEEDEIIIEGEGVEPEKKPGEEAKNGLRSIRHLAVRRALQGIKIEEKDGVIHLERPFHADEDVKITIPSRASLIVDRHLEGDIKVDGVKGSLEIKSIDGDTELIDIGGPLVINSVDGDIKAVFAGNSIPGDSVLTSVDGDIDIYVSEDCGLYLYLKTLEGDVLSDLEIEAITQEELKKEAGLDEDTGPRVYAGYYSDDDEDSSETYEDAMEDYEDAMEDYEDAMEDAELSQREAIELQREAERNQRKAENAEREYAEHMREIEINHGDNSIRIPLPRIPDIPEIPALPGISFGRHGFYGADQIVIYAKLNNGGSLIRATTIDGDITIRKKK